MCVVACSGSCVELLGAIGGFATLFSGKAAACSAVLFAGSCRTCAVSTFLVTCSGSCVAVDEADEITLNSSEKKGGSRWGLGHFLKVTLLVVALPQ